MLNRVCRGSGGERHPRPSVWNLKWDRQEPLSLFNLWKRNLEFGEPVSSLDHYKAKAMQAISLVRALPVPLDASLEKACTLRPLALQLISLPGD